MNQIVSGVAPQPYRFADDGRVPNNPALPMLVYPQVLKLDAGVDAAAAFERTFASNDWGQSWRNGIYPFVHYHSAVHEVLGIARGGAKVRFGGDGGVTLSLGAGDVAVLPAGTGHHCLGASAELLVVGAYPPEGEYDLCRGTDEEYRRARVAIAKVPLPQRDPLYGDKGPLIGLWGH